SQRNCRQAPDTRMTDMGRRSGCSSSNDDVESPVPMGFCVPAPVIAQNLPGLQYFRLLGPLFDHLHAVGTARDRAGNRQLFYDQYATLLLLYFFNPTVTSLRGLQQMTTFAHVQAQFGIRRTS